MKLLEKERIDLIYKNLLEKKYLKYEEIEDFLNISSSTVRRDVEKMSKMSLCNKISGGIELINNNKDETYIYRKSKNIDKKKKIAKIASKYLKNGDTIYLDAGSSTSLLIPYLNKMDITIVTNCVAFLDNLINQNNNVILLGGKIKNNTRCMIGSMAYEQLNNFSFDKAFIGTNAIDEELNLSTPDIEEAKLKSLAIKNSKEVYILADSSKFFKKSSVIFSRDKNINIISDKEINRKD